MRVREIEGAYLNELWEATQASIKEARNKHNALMTQLSADNHNQRMDGIFSDIEADEHHSPTGTNSIGRWIDSDPWAVQDYIDRHEAKKALGSINEPETESNIRWMKDEIKRRRHERLMKHKTKRKSPKKRLKK